MEIKKMTAAHEAAVMQMMKDFYESPAVLSNGSPEIFRADITACITDNPFLEGYVFAEGETLMGYAMVATTFNCEYGRICKWIEDLYIRPEFRSQGIGGAFLDYVVESNPGVLLRLEAEEENACAIAVYKKCGFEVLPYLEMKK